MNPLPDAAAIGAALVRQGPDAVIYADRDGRIGLWNAAAERIFGFTAAEALGRSLDLIIPERLRARHWQGYHAMMAGAAGRHAADALLSVPALSKDGATLSIQFTVTPVLDATGRPQGIVALLRDATAQFQELKRLRAAAASG